MRFITIFALIGLAAAAAFADDGPMWGGVFAPRQHLFGPMAMRRNNPLNAMMNAMHVGIHSDASNTSDQLVSYHFCSDLKSGLMQCALFDGETAASKLIGVEYVIPKSMFKQLSADEQKLWHRHDIPIKEGYIAYAARARFGRGRQPLPEEEQRAMLMEHIFNTFGKTFHTWPTKSLTEEIPLGSPQLMMVPMNAQEAVNATVKRLDKVIGTSINERKEMMSDVRISGDEKVDKPIEKEKPKPAEEIKPKPETGKTEEKPAAPAIPAPPKSEPKPAEKPKA